MYKYTNPLFLICETPLHAGSGDDLGIIDLPIQRERHTSFPKIEASSFKGAMREAFETTVNSKEFKNWDDDDVVIHRLFGFDDGGGVDKEKLKSIFKYMPKNGTKEEDKKEGNDFSGCVAFTDARLLLFPVKSMKGVFVWITCPQVLNRLASDLKIAEKTPFTTLEKVLICDPEEGQAFVADRTKVSFEDNMVLEEFAFKATYNSQVADFAIQLAALLFKDENLSFWKEKLESNFVLLNNNDFKDFVNHSTEVITRIKINNESGTVEDGALFTEEYLPCDSVMYSLVMFSDEFNKREKESEKMKVETVQTFFKTKLISMRNLFQLGGNTNLGKGILRTQLID